MSAVFAVCSTITWSHNAAPLSLFQVFNDEGHRLNVYGDDVEVDYRGAEVTVESFMRVLTGEHRSLSRRAHSGVQQWGACI